MAPATARGASWPSPCAAPGMTATVAGWRARAARCEAHRPVVRGIARAAHDHDRHVGGRRIDLRVVFGLARVGWDLDGSVAFGHRSHDARSPRDLPTPSLGRPRDHARSPRRSGRGRPGPETTHGGRSLSAGAGDS
jgi:hypothetical protein